MLCGLLSGLFSGGALCGGVLRRLSWLLLSWLLFDGVMHVGFGFGLNEVQIMAAHWMFAIPLATAFLLKRFEATALGRALTLLVQCLVVGTACYNVALIVSYFI